MQKIQSVLSGFVALVIAGGLVQVTAPYYERQGTIQVGTIADCEAGNQLCSGNLVAKPDGNLYVITDCKPTCGPFQISVREVSERLQFRIDPGHLIDALTNPLKIKVITRDDGPAWRDAWERYSLQFSRSAAFR